MKYNRKFELSLADIEVIETCLSRELHARSEKFRELDPNGDMQKIDTTKQEMSEITELQGKLHHQKNWYTGNPAEVPTG
jgi:hypothetical protein